MATLRKQNNKLFSNSDNKQSDIENTPEINDESEHKLRSDDNFDEQKLGESEVNIDQKTNRPKKVSINFMDEDYIDDYTSQPTPDAINNEKGEKQTVDGIRNQIREEESQPVEQMSIQDYEDIADFLITLIDAGMSTALRMYAKDTSDSAYSLKEAKKKMLRVGLTKILIKYNSRFSIEFMFLVGLIIAYVGPVSEARSRRKEIKKYSEPTQESNEDNSNIIVPEVLQSDQPKHLRRKRGAARKSS